MAKTTNQNKRQRIAALRESLAPAAAAALEGAPRALAFARAFATTQKCVYVSCVCAAARAPRGRGCVPRAVCGSVRRPPMRKAAAEGGAYFGGLAAEQGVSADAAEPWLGRLLEAARGGSPPSLEAALSATAALRERCLGGANDPPGASRGPPAVLRYARGRPFHPKRLWAALFTQGALAKHARYATNLTPPMPRTSRVLLAVLAPGEGSGGRRSGRGRSVFCAPTKEAAPRARGGVCCCCGAALASSARASRGASAWDDLCCTRSGGCAHLQLRGVAGVRWVAARCFLGRRGKRACGAWGGGGAVSGVMARSGVSLQRHGAYVTRAPSRGA